MKKKFIFITNSTKPSAEERCSLEGNFINNVNQPSIKSAISLGYDVILGVNRKYPEKLVCPDYPIDFYDSNTFRSLLNIKDNLRAYKNLAFILKKGDVEVIHCNTPIGGMIGRICARRYHVPKVIYTAHGFHFFKGAPLFNNTVLKWSEQLMAHWTDILITLNEEDYQVAQHMKLKHKGKVYKLHGVGINTEEFRRTETDKEKFRKSLGLEMDDFICITTGDLVKGKNHATSIQAIAKCNNKKVHLLICGDGAEKQTLCDLAQSLNVENQIHLLGFRRDIKELLFISDCFLFLSYREGLSRSLMEGMASGLPCIVSDIRGNRDLISQDDNGFLVSANDYRAAADKIILLHSNQDIVNHMRKANLERIKNFDISVVEEEMMEIYENELRK